MRAHRAHIPDIAWATAHYDDHFYLGGDGVRRTRTDIELLALVALTYVNTGYDGPENQSVLFDFQVECSNMDGANVYITDDVRSSVNVTPLARGSFRPLPRTAIWPATCLGNFRTAGSFSGQHLTTLVAHGLQDDYRLIWCQWSTECGSAPDSRQATRRRPAPNEAAREVLGSHIARRGPTVYSGTVTDCLLQIHN